MADTLLRETVPPLNKPASPVPQAWDPDLGGYRKVTGKQVAAERFALDNLVWGQTPSGVYVPVRVNDSGAVSVSVDQSSVAYDAADDMLKIKSMQRKWRDSFGGSGLDASKWTLVSQGTGHTVTVSGGTLTISTGTTANTETILETKDVFTIPCRAIFGAYISQKIANQEFVMELVSVDPVTLQADGQFAAAWVWSYEDSSTNDYAVYEVQSNGLSRLRSSAVDTNVAETSYGVWEIEAFADECWFHARAMDSANGRSYSAVRHQQIPDPNRLYKVRIRVRNKATAPASSTSFIAQFVTVMDYAELTAEVTASRGIISAGQSLGVYLANSPTVYAYLTSASVTPYTDTTTNLGAGGTYTGSSRDMGSSSFSNARFRVMVAHAAGNTPGHLVLEQSTDGSTWRETHRIPIPSDGLYRTFDFPVLLRYCRVKFINGSTAQTLMFLASALVKTDGTFDINKTLSFVHSTTPLGASASFTGAALDLGGNHGFSRHRATVYADQSGTLYLEESRDGTVWRTVKTVNVSAGVAIADEIPITQRYQRVRYANGATSQTAFELVSTLYMT